MTDEQTEAMNARLREYEQQIKGTEDPVEAMRLTKEAMDYVAGLGVTIPVESLESTARFAAHVVDTVLVSIVRTAEEMGTDMVPVGFIESLRPAMPEYISKSLLKAAGEIGVPIGFADGVPDDLSGLEL